MLLRAQRGEGAALFPFHRFLLQSRSALTGTSGFLKTPMAAKCCGQSDGVRISSEAEGETSSQTVLQFSFCQQTQTMVHGILNGEAK